MPRWRPATTFERDDVRVFNNSTVDIADGRPCVIYDQGVDGGNIVVRPGRADATNANQRGVILIASTAIAAGATGFARATRVLTGQNTSAGAHGDPVYLDPGAPASGDSGWTLTDPTGTATRIIGRVLGAAGTLGKIAFGDVQS